MVRIRFYDVDLKTGLPSNDLLKENIILVVNEKQTIINANVSDYYIPFNENGIFIGLDLLGYIGTRLLFLNRLKIEFFLTLT